MSNTDIFKKEKWILLPANELVCEHYSGYVKDGKPDPGAGPEELLSTRYYFNYRENTPKPLIYFRVVVLLPVVLLLLPYLIIWHFIKPHDHHERLIRNIHTTFHTLFPLYREKKSIKESVPLPPGVFQVDIPQALGYMRQSRFKIAAYNITTVSQPDNPAITRLIREGILDAYIPDKGSSLLSFLKQYAHMRNTHVALVEQPAGNELKDLYPSDDVYRNRVLVWDPSKGNSEGDKESGTLSSTPYIQFLHVSHYAYSPSVPGRVKNIVYYIGYEGDAEMRRYIAVNHDELSSRFAEKGFEFYYFPIELKVKREKHAERLVNWLQFNIPQLRNNDLGAVQSGITQKLKETNPLELEESFFIEQQLPDLGGPVFLRYVGEADSTDEDQFTWLSLPLRPQDDLENKLEQYFKQLYTHIYDGAVYSRPKQEKGHWNAELFFHERADEIYNGISEADEEELEKIREITARLKLDESPQLLSGLLKVIADQADEETRKMINDFLLTRKSQPRYSPVRITSDCRIFLPDYNNMEILMYPLAKILFFLFLRHPEGLLFKELVDHQEELQELYVKTTGRPVSLQVEQSIEDLVDATCPSVNQKVARIRSAFRSRMPEEIAAYYYVTGQNGVPKKILAANGHIIDEAGVLGRG